MLYINDNMCRSKQAKLYWCSPRPSRWKHNGLKKLQCSTSYSEHICILWMHKVNLIHFTIYRVFDKRTQNIQKLPRALQKGDYKKLRVC